MRTIMSKIALAPLALCMALTVGCLTLFAMNTAALAQVTFSVEGKGEGTIRIDLLLSPAAGVDRGELLTMGRLGAARPAFQRFLLPGHPAARRIGRPKMVGSKRQTQAPIALR